MRGEQRVCRCELPLFAATRCKMQREPGPEKNRSMGGGIRASDGCRRGALGKKQKPYDLMSYRCFSVSHALRAAQAAYRQSTLRIFASLGVSRYCPSPAGVIRCSGCLIHRRHRLVVFPVGRSGRSPLSAWLLDRRWLARTRCDTRRAPRRWGASSKRSSARRAPMIERVTTVFGVARVVRGPGTARPRHLPRGQRLPGP